MPDIVLKGNTSTSVSSQVQQQDYLLQALIVVNKTGGPVTVNVQILNTNSGGPNISPYNMAIAANASYEAGGYTIKAGDIVNITVTGSCDYYIDLTPLS